MVRLLVDPNQVQSSSEFGKIQETGTHHFYALPLDEGHLKKQIKDMHSELHLFWRRDTADKTRWIPCVCDCRF